eukprot:12869755-Ditylum_brightwellii.AAC.1
MDKTKQALREGATDIKKKRLKSDALNLTNNVLCEHTSIASDTKVCKANTVPVDSLTTQQLKRYASEAMTYAATLQKIDHTPKDDEAAVSDDPPYIHYDATEINSLIQSPRNCHLSENSYPINSGMKLCPETVLSGKN